MDHRHNPNHSSVGGMLLKAAFVIGVAVVKKAIEDSSKRNKPPEGGAGVVKPGSPEKGGPR